MAYSIHLMDHDQLFRQARPLLRPGGGVAILANGTPLWQQSTPAADALRAFLEQWFKVRLTSACGTGQESRTHYATVLKAAGYIDVQETVLTDYEDALDVEHVLTYAWMAGRKAPGLNGSMGPPCMGGGTG